jgi:hypothetical protein
LIAICVSFLWFFAICALSQNFILFIGFMLVSIFPLLLHLALKKKKKNIAFASLFEDCVAALIARKKSFLHKFFAVHLEYK